MELKRGFAAAAAKRAGKLPQYKAEGGWVEAAKRRKEKERKMRDYLASEDSRRVPWSFDPEPPEKDEPKKMAKGGMVCPHCGGDVDEEGYACGGAVASHAEGGEVEPLSDRKKKAFSIIISKRMGE